MDPLAREERACGGASMGLMVLLLQLETELSEMLLPLAVLL